MADRHDDGRTAYLAELAQINAACERLGVTPIFTEAVAEFYETADLPGLITRAQMFLVRRERQLGGTL
jgi:hypothetical protein